MMFLSAIGSKNKIMIKHFTCKSEVLFLCLRFLTLFSGICLKGLSK